MTRPPRPPPDHPRARPAARLAGAAALLRALDGRPSDPVDWSDDDDVAERVDRLLGEPLIFDLDPLADPPPEVPAIIRRARLTPTEKEARVVELRKARWSFADIAREVGYADQSGAHKAFQRALTRVVVEDVEDIRRTELLILDEVHAAAYAQAMLGNLPAIDRVVKIGEARRRLVPGLEAPRTTDLNLGAGGPVTVVFQVGDPRTAQETDPIRVIPQDELAGGAIDATSTPATSS